MIISKKQQSVTVKRMQGNTEYRKYSISGTQASWLSYCQFAYLTDNKWLVSELFLIAI